MRAPPSGSGCSTTLGKELGKTPQRPMVGTVAPPKPDTFSPNSTSLYCAIAELARRATRLRPPCGTRARPRTAMREPNMIWRSFMRRGTACRAISIWRQAGTLLRRLAGWPQRRARLSRCAKRSAGCRIVLRRKTDVSPGSPNRTSTSLRYRRQARASRSSYLGLRRPSLCRSTFSCRFLRWTRPAPIAPSPAFQNSRRCSCRCHGLPPTTPGASIPSQRPSPTTFQAPGVISPHVDPAYGTKLLIAHRSPLADRGGAPFNSPRFTTRRAGLGSR